MLFYFSQRLSFFSLLVIFFLNFFPSFTFAITYDMGVRQNFGKGPGYNHGYSTLEALIIPSINDGKFIPFLDVRGHRFDNNHYGANVGIGTRFYSNVSQIAWGANLYYDNRHVKRACFNQIGLGFEILNPIVCFRINGYQPVGKKKALVQRCIFDHYSGGYVMSRNKYHTVLKGGDAELELTFLSMPYIQLYGALGPYYLIEKFSDKKKIVGGQFRLSAQINNFFGAKIFVTHDRYFRTRTSFQISVNIPFGDISDFFQNWFIMQPVQRHEIIATDKNCCWHSNF